MHIKDKKVLRLLGPRMRKITWMELNDMVLMQADKQRSNLCCVGKESNLRKIIVHLDTLCCNNPFFNCSTYTNSVIVT